MPLTEIKDKYGNVIGHAIVCTRGRKVPECKFCRENSGKTVPSTKLCDFPVKRGDKAVTCDAAMCDRHSKHVGPDEDYCPVHAQEHKP